MDAQELIEATTRTWNERDRDGYLALYTDDCEIIAPGFTGRGHEDLGAFYDVQMTTLPDNRITVLRTAVGDGGRDVGAGPWRPVTVLQQIRRSSHGAPQSTANGCNQLANAAHEARAAAPFTILIDWSGGPRARSPHRAR